MKPNQSHVAGLELALSTAESMRYASELDAIDTIHAIEHGLSLLIEQAKSAPPSPDAELVELLAEVRKRCQLPDWARTRIDAKLATL